MNKPLTISTMNKPLTVYKASAGSGKTFTLAVEYIKLLIKNPESYRHTLAVTFTNKATEEMKMRILSQLNGLAKGYEDSNDYLEKICEELGCAPDFVRENAQKALTNIIHHYHYFRVETIDKFFQRVLRNLAHELGLTPNLRIELNGKQVEQQAVDIMINQLKDNDPEMKWLLEYIQKNISTDRTWNVIGNVKRFGENIFNDNYRKHYKDMEKIMSESQFFSKFSKQLYSFREQCVKKSTTIIKDLTDQFFNATKDYEIDDFFKKTTGIYSYFLRLREGDVFIEPSATVKGCMESPEAWGNKNSKNLAAINALASNTLIGILKSIDNTRQESIRLIKTAEIVMSNLYQLGLLVKIEKTVREINQEGNRFLLSDTQGMLRELIGDSDTPFIFEKTGAILSHIMIDEFQDTGRVQWQNFKILLNNCMAQNKGNLIVGDVKQSIYRWRSGDWKLLNGIEKEFNEEQLHVTELKYNFRSSRHVVNFNNVFFQTAAKKETERLEKIVGKEAEQLKTAYGDVIQKIHPKKVFDGYVKVELLPYDLYNASVMEHISQIIHTLLERGVDQSKIAILSRRREDINSTTMYFHEHEPEIHVVSDEAFHLNSSIVLDILITSLRVLVDPNDRLNKSTLAKNYQNVILGKNINDSELPRPIDEGPDPLDTWLPNAYIGEANRHRLLLLPLNELVEALFEIFELDKIESQSAYVCSFYDQLNTFLADNIGDVETFLEKWDEEISSQDIQGAQVEGIRMVTIHKSKGLEFDHVILPFCNWRLEQNNIIWCDSDHAPFNQLPILPVNYTKAMASSLYAEDYNYEHLQNSVDNLNLLYVAFTRAKNSLFVIGQRTKTKKKEEESEKSKKAKKKDEKKKESESPEKLTHITRSELIEQCLPEMEKLLPESTYKTLDDGTMVLEYGTPDNINVKDKKEKKQTENVFLQKEVEQTFTIKSQSSKAQFLQSNASKSYTSDDDNNSRSEYIVRGTLLHSIFSRLHDINDINRVLRQLTMEGVLYDDISPKELQDMLHQALSNEQVRSWFSPKWEVHNECAILFRDPESDTVVERRPDRVISDANEIIVVDFKFGKPHKEHQTQVKLYMGKLHEMDPRPVKGYLWYVTQQKVEEV